MKKQKDEIKKLFDDYADELTPRQDLASKAKVAMSVKNANKQSNQGNNRSANRRFGWMASLASAFVVLIICVGIILPQVNGNRTDGPINSEQTTPGSDQSGQTGDGTSNSIVYYAMADVKGKSVPLDEVDDMLMTSRLRDDSDCQVVSERYYAFYTDDGTLAYIKALLGVRTDDGFVEITLIAEVDGMVRNDLKDVYRSHSHVEEGHLVGDTLLDDKGEYVTQGYFNARNMHFYVYAKTGANSWLSEKIIQNLL